MKKILPSLFAAALLCTCAVGHADSAPFGVASAFNLVALGYTNGNTAIAGNISTASDVEGRVAAAGTITQLTSVGATLHSDPWGSLANNYAIVAGDGITVNGYISVGGGGNVYATSNSAHYNWNENPRGTLVTTGSDPIDFSSLRTTLDAQSQYLATLSPTGSVGVGGGTNPSWDVLSGTSATLNVFSLTSAEFDSSNNNLDISVPVGSTVIINVAGTQLSLGTGIYFNGQQEGDSNNNNGDILFNFAHASSVNIDGQLDGAVLAPFATFTSNSQVGGNLIAAAINQTGEVHNIEFNGKLPSPPPPMQPAVTPEPGTLLLMGTGIFLMACFTGIRRRREQAGFDRTAL